MTNTPNPWRPNGTSPSPHPARVYIWLALMLALSLGVWGLFALFPEVALSHDDEARLFYLVGVLAAVSSGFVFARRMKWSEAARNIAIWAGIAAVLVVGYAFQDSFGDLGARIRSGLLPSEPVTSGARAFVLTESADGDYQATGEVDGTRVRFVVDTGASDIVLSPADAKRAGIDIAALAYDRETGTANGTGHAAAYTLARLDLGPVHLTDVPVMIDQAAMDNSLLGMSFLRRMKSFEFKDRVLTLRWR